MCEARSYWQIVIGATISNARSAISLARFAEREITFELPWRLLEKNVKIAAIDLVHDRLE
jgi:hypothetical protein